MVGILRGRGREFGCESRSPSPPPLLFFSTNSHRNTCYILCRLFSRPFRGKVTWEKTFFLVTKQWLACFCRQWLVFLVSFYSAHDQGWSPFALKRLAPATKTKQWLTQELLLLHLLFFINVKLVYLCSIECCFLFFDTWRDILFFVRPFKRMFYLYIQKSLDCFSQKNGKWKVVILILEFFMRLCIKVW